MRTSSSDRELESLHVHRPQPSHEGSEIRSSYSTVLVKGVGNVNFIQLSIYFIH